MLRQRILPLLAIAVSLLFCLPILLQAQTNSLALFNIRAKNMEAMGHNTDILYSIISALNHEKSINLISRRSMEETLKQAGLAQSDKPDKVIKIGKALGVDFILFGHVTKEGSKLITQFKLMDIPNKTILRTWDYTFPGKQEMANQVRSLTKDLCGTIADREQYLSSPTLPPLLTKPQIDIDIKNFYAKSKGDIVFLSWEFDASQPIVGFNIYRSENRKGPYQLIGKTSKKIFNDTKIKKDGSFFYNIGILLSSTKEIKGRNILQLEHICVKLPYPPLIMEVKGHVRRTEIKFVPSLLNEQEKFKVISYRIYRRKDAAHEWEVISTVSTEDQSGMAFTVEDNKLEDGQAYEYAASSLDKKKNESHLSDPISLSR